MSKSLQKQKKAAQNQMKVVKELVEAVRELLVDFDFDEYQFVHNSILHGDSGGFLSSGANGKNLSLGERASSQHVSADMQDRNGPALKKQALIKPGHSPNKTSEKKSGPHQGAGGSTAAGGTAQGKKQHGKKGQAAAAGEVGEGGAEK